MAPRGALLPALAVAATVLVASCGSPDYHYVKSTADRTFMRVPSSWKLYSEDDLLRSSDQSAEAKAQFKSSSWSVAFDASPKPSLEHVLSLADHPTGLAQVRRILPSQQDSFTRADLRAMLLHFDPLSDDAQADGEVEVLDAREVKQGSLYGSDLLLNLRTEDGDLVKWRQIALVDPGLTRAHILALSCDDECYTANEKVIDAVIDSWKVTKP